DARRRVRGSGAAWVGGGLPSGRGQWHGSGRGRRALEVRGGGGEKQARILRGAVALLQEGAARASEGGGERRGVRGMGVKRSEGVSWTWRRVLEDAGARVGDAA